MPWYRLAFRPDVIGDLSAAETAMAQRLFDKTKWLASNVDNLRHEPVAAVARRPQIRGGRLAHLYSIDRAEQLVDAIQHRPPGARAAGGRTMLNLARVSALERLRALIRNILTIRSYGLWCDVTAEKEEKRLSPITLGDDDP